MGIVVLPKTHTAHTTAVAADVMANHNALLTAINGGLDDENLATAIVNALFAPGDIKACARSSAPEGWLLCDGSAVSRETYADLFAAIGTTYGVGNGSTTFNIPDLRGRVPVGVDGSAGRLSENDALGNSGGHKNLPAHSHGVGSLGTNSTGSHAHKHGAWTSLGVASGSGIIAEFLLAGGSALTENTGGHSHTVSGNTADAGTGPSGGDDRMQPFQVVQFMVKV